MMNSSNVKDGLFSGNAKNLPSPAKVYKDKEHFIILKVLFIRILREKKQGKT